MLPERLFCGLGHLTPAFDVTLLDLQYGQRLGSGLRLFNPSECQRGHYVLPGVAVHFYGSRFDREILIVDLEVANLIAPIHSGCQTVNTRRVILLPWIL
jgi:hypothetical protein